MNDNEILDINDLENEINLIKDTVKGGSDKSEKCNDQKDGKEFKYVTIQKEYLRIKVFGIITALFLKLLYKIIILVLLYVSLKVPVIKSFLLSVYFAHYLFFFMFVLLTIDIIFFITKFMSDVQEILMENIYIETVTKQEKVALD